MKPTTCELTFLEQYRCITHPDPVLRGLEQRACFGEWMLREPHALLFELLEHAPVFQTDGDPPIVVLCRRADVLDVFARDREFAVMYADKLYAPRGLFVLGMPDGEQYRQERHVITDVLPMADLVTVEQAIMEQTRTLLAGQPPTFDVIQEVVWPVLLGHLRSYFGFGCGVPTLVLRRWMRDIYCDVLQNLGDNRLWREAATRAFEEVNAYVARTTPPAGSIWARLASRLDADATRRNIIGLCTGVVETTLKTVTRALDQFLDRPTVQSAAREALQTEDLSTFMTLTWECLRFNPQNHALYRRCTQDVTLSSGATVPAGALVFLSTLTAMHDPAYVRSPEEFRTDRPANTYLFFGHGLHKCGGQLLAPALIRGLLRELLLVPWLLRHPDDPFCPVDVFPSHFLLEKEGV